MRQGWMHVAGFEGQEKFAPKTLASAVYTDEGGQQSVETQLSALQSAMLGLQSGVNLRRVNENGAESETGQYIQMWNGSEWLWDSIPNKLGVEYKTTRLYLDKPVYACKLDFPIANNGSATQMPAETEAFLVEQNLLFKSNDGQYRFMLPYLDPQYPIYLSLRGRGVMVHKNTGWGDGRIYGTVYYTKGVPA